MRAAAIGLIILVAVVALLWPARSPDRVSVEEAEPRPTLEQEHVPAAPAVGLAERTSPALPTWTMDESPAVDRSVESEPVTQERFRIFGQVTDLLGRPVADPEIVLRLSIRHGVERTARVSTSGRFAIDDVPPAFCALTIEGPGIEKQTVSDKRTWVVDRDVQCDVQVTQIREIDLRARWDSGLVGAEAQKEIIENATLLSTIAPDAVSVRNTWIQRWSWDPAQAAWRARIQVGTADVCALEMQSRGESIAHVVVPAGVDRAELVVTARPTLRGRLTGRIAIAAPDVSARVCVRGALEVGVMRTMTSGEFSREDLPYGSYQWVVYAEGFEPVSGTVELQASEVDLGTIHVDQPGVEIEGTVEAVGVTLCRVVWISRADQQLPAARYPWWPPEVEAGWHQASFAPLRDEKLIPVDDSGRGRFRFSVPRGEYTLDATSVDAPGVVRLVAGAVDVDARLASVTGVRLALRSVSYLYVRLTDPWSDPVSFSVEDARGVVLERSDCTRTGRDLPLGAGRYRVRWTDRAGMERQEDVVVAGESTMIEIGEDEG